MNKKTLGICLTLLTIALWLGPIVTAFASNGWSVKKTIMPSEERINDVSDEAENILGDELSEKNFEIKSATIKDGRIILDIEFNSPFKFSLTIENLNGDIHEKRGEGFLSTVKLKEPVKIPSQGSGDLRLTGKISKDLDEVHPQDLTFSGGIFKIRASEISVEISIEEEEVS